LLPFRSQPAIPRLREGYELLQGPELPFDQLNGLLQACGDSPRSPERWRRVLKRSSWHLAVIRGEERLVGFVRATSDRALNANLWDLLSDPHDPARPEVIAVLVQSALGRLRREMGGCSISVSAPPEALQALTQAGFVVDPGGIRAMGLALRQEE
jgi:hypothetical protein